jgi:exopolyphosphatase/guanosine-5'-triphosphate,3'-diphosphate pyrophosphatase
VLRPRIEDLATSLKRLSAIRERESDAAVIAEAVHKTRVAARRAGVALTILKDCCSAREWAQARKSIRRVRRGAGVLRDADVHMALIDALRAHTQAPESIVQYVADHIAQDREEGARRLSKTLGDEFHKRIRRDGRAVLDSLRCGDGPARSMSLSSLSRDELSRLANEVLAVGSQDTSVPEHLHELRLAVKRLRYTAEIFAVCIDESVRARLAELLEEAQRQAGEVNDVLTLVARLSGYEQELESASDSDPTLIEGLVALRDRYAAVGERRCERFAAWWQGQDLQSVLSPLVITDEEPESPAPPQQLEQPRREEMEPGMREAGQGPIEHAHGNGAAALPSQRNLWLSGRRLAVIDIGSNSIRLLAVELIDERSWKPLAEERAMTRLAQGMGKGGMICPEAMARSVEAVGRFKAIAEKIGVTNIRAFATAAVREARNKADFISLVQDRTGLKLELVSALEEGKLTHRSVARVFDLTHGTAAVADIGGGSLEVVFSTNGVITENSSMPLGAVRVTEAFGGADQCGGPNYKKMRQFIEKSIAKDVREHDLPPTILVGCGGSFTTLLTLAAASRGVMLDRSSPALASLGPVARPQLKALLKELRSMTLEQRLRVPGLPSDRADIVIAGFTAIDRLMKYLGATQVHVHPGGVREGLLLRLIDQEIAERARPGSAHTSDAELVQAAREFAIRCSYERAHSEHVSTVALSLFDQFRDESNLIAGLGNFQSERALLEAAAVLHDIGTMVEYPRHHKYSQTIIRHANLRGWSARQVELVAAIARYHRRAVPSLEHAEFRALSDAERAVVRRLAALLRVAEGLDRSHSQSVRAVRVRFGKRSVHLEVSAESEPTTDLEAASEKSDLLNMIVGETVEIAFEAAQPQPPPSPGSGSSSRHKVQERAGV